MLDATRWNMGPLFQNAGKDEGDAKTLTLDGDYLFGEGNAFKKLSFGVRYDDRGAIHYQPEPTASPFMPAPRTLAQMPEGMLWNNSDFFDGADYIPGSWLVPNGYWIQDHADEVRASRQGAIQFCLVMDLNENRQPRRGCERLKMP